MKQFVKIVRKSKRVWGLEDADGWSLCESSYYDDVEVMPFWSDKAAAQAHCVDEWVEFEAAYIEVDEFLETWLMGMAQDDVLVGLDWGGELTGAEVRPEDLEQALLGERYGA